MKLRNVINYLTAKDEREELRTLAEKAAAREGKSKHEKPADARRRAELQRTISRRYFLELLAGGAGLGGLTYAFKDHLLGSAASDTPAFDEFDLEAPGMLKQVHWLEDRISPQERAALDRSLPEAYRYALQTPRKRDFFRNANIEIVIAPNLQMAVDVVSERAGVPRDRRMNLAGWTGDAVTMSTASLRTGTMTHTHFFLKQLTRDSLKFGTALNHELEHALRVEEGTFDGNQAREERAAFTASIRDMELLLRQLERKHGAAHPDTVRLRDEILPRERRMLLHWQR